MYLCICKGWNASQQTPSYQPCLNEFKWFVLKEYPSLKIWFLHNTWPNTRFQQCSVHKKYELLWTMYLFKSTWQVCRQSELHCSSSSVERLKYKAALDFYWQSVVFRKGQRQMTRVTFSPGHNTVRCIAFCCYINLCCLVCRRTGISLQIESLIASPHFIVSQ